MVAPETRRIVDAFEDALTASADRLTQLRAPGGDLGAELANSRQLMNWLFDGGWVRWGWPPEVGGLGGSSLIRCQILERLALHGYDIPHHLQVLEVVGPAVINHARSWRQPCCLPHCAVMNCGARAFPNPRRVATLPRCAPGRRCATTADS